MEDEILEIVSSWVLEDSIVESELEDESFIFVCPSNHSFAPVAGVWSVATGLATLFELLVSENSSSKTSKQVKGGLQV